MRYASLACALLIAGCMPFKYSDVPLDEVVYDKRTYSVALKTLPSGDFDVVVANLGVRWLPDEIEMRQEFMAVGRQRAAAHCAGREAELIDAAKPWAEFAGLDMRFRCK